jgi:uncharacterized surface anchored protein
MGSSFSRVGVSVVLPVLLLSVQLNGQTLGTVTGEVKDSTGAIVTGATITVRNVATNGIRNATTNEDGAYTIPALIPGMYEVRLSGKVSK